jgi:hypothetical protein
MAVKDATIYSLGGNDIIGCGLGDNVLIGGDEAGL